MATRSPPDAAVASLREACARLVYTSIRTARSDAGQEGISMPQLFLLGALARSGPTPVTRLTAWTGARAPTLSGALDALVEAGWVARTHGTADRRQVIVTLSPRGRRVAARLESRSAARWKRLAPRLASPDARVAVQVLRQVVEGLTGEDGRGGSRALPVAAGRSSGALAGARR